MDKTKSKMSADFIATYIKTLLFNHDEISQQISDLEWKLSTNDFAQEFETEHKQELANLKIEQAELQKQIAEDIGAFKEKADGYAYVFRSFQQDIDLQKVEIERIRKRTKAIERQKINLMSHLINVMDFLEIKKFKTPLNTIAIRESKSVVVDFPAESLPLIYRREKTTIDANKTEIKKALVAGKTVPGARIVDKRTINVR